jgi:hypothetical protein
VRGLKWLMIKILNTMRYTTSRLGGLVGYYRKAVALAVKRGVTDPRISSLATLTLFLGPLATRCQDGQQVRLTPIADDSRELETQAFAK